MGLDTALDLIVSKVTINSGVKTKKALERVINKNLTTILGVLKVLILNVLADSLGNLNTALHLVFGATEKLGELGANLDGLEETILVSINANLLTRRLGAGKLVNRLADRVELLDNIVENRYGLAVLASLGIRNFALDAKNRVVDYVDNIFRRSELLVLNYRSRRLNNRGRGGSSLGGSAFYSLLFNRGGDDGGINLFAGTSYLGGSG
jgi:hypothetical protein